MDKTNVTIKIPGRILTDDDNFIDIDEQKLVERLMKLLQSRKKISNVSFQSNDNANKKNVDTTTKIEMLLSNDDGDFDYYED